MLLVDFLGADPTEAHAQASGKGLSVDLKWLREVVYPRAITEERWAHAARAYLLYLLGTTIFVDKSGSKVKIAYLDMLVDLEQTGGYSWGGMALAHLYAQLGDASKFKCKQMAGCITLLIGWIAEHFQTANFGCKHLNEAYDEAQPRAMRWVLENPGGDRQAIRVALDRLQPDDVVWEPYTPHRHVRPLEPVSLFRGFVRHATCMLPYLPDRVVRQFGYVQGIPEDPSPHTRLAITLEEADAMWMQFDEHVIQAGLRDTDGRGDTAPGYYSWFARVSHPFLLPSSYDALDDVPEASLVMPDVVELLDELERSMEGTVPRGTQPRTILDRLRSIVRPFRRIRRFGCTYRRRDRATQ